MRTTRTIQKNINAGSMADIAFLLLVFFLVTTTMQSETGLPRKLPPAVDASGEVARRNVFTVHINANNEILAANQQVTVGELCTKALEFIENANNRSDLPEKEWTDIEGLGEIQVSKQVIALQSDRRTSYEAYVGVQNALSKAYALARDHLAEASYHQSYGALLASGDVDRVRAIQQAIPQRISESEPIQTQQP